MSQDLTPPPDPDPTELARASRVLHLAGMRLMRLAGVVTVGLWSDLDSPKVRAALHVFGSDGLPIRYLDGPCYIDRPAIPARFKLRRVDGDPVPLHIVAEMERHPEEPWTIRDRMLKQIGWHSKPHSTDVWSWRDVARVEDDGDHQEA